MSRTLSLASAIEFNDESS